MEKTTIVIKSYETPRQREERVNPVATHNVDTLAEFDKVVDVSEKLNYLIFESINGMPLTYQGCRFLLYTQEQEKEPEDA